jgi:plastocyanin
MKRLLAVLALLLLSATGARAAAVSGSVSFVTKRGQNPVKAGTFQMLTRGKAIAPHVLAVPVGSTVSFPNDDPISHNLFSLSAGNSFDLGLYRRGPGKSHSFDSAGIVNVYCNVHPNMSAVVHVMPTPYYAFADGSGNYSIPDVPAGKYTLVAWNEQGGAARSDIDVAATGAVTGNVALTLDSRNYRLAQHLNKEGKAYQAPSKDY